ncbi:hypothetical protein AYO20_04476 [Fonsecaea nubica]|uniref:Cytochrome b5 heme-binding domain-containing protein n=1 Tax=Fonsecaea nubica TaxID=856822 RepID=A0A178D2G0_9EURO|nr:hypothetical protein AYO20_04476 [Fonsecaea nubica]OAL36318.1 hypothetical protein AYO20_04476 [Fonsecaea nubica]
MDEEEGYLLSPAPTCGRSRLPYNYPTSESSSTTRRSLVDGEDPLRHSFSAGQQPQTSKSSYSLSSIDVDETLSSHSTKATTVKPGPRVRTWNPATWFRRVDPSKLAGWRFGALLGFVLCAVILVCNLVLLAVGWSRASRTRGMGIVSSGSATKVAWLGTFSHILINVFSTALLSASNYCMQVITAPTREQADAAHHDGGFVDIGVLTRSLSIYCGPTFVPIYLGVPHELTSSSYNSAVSDVLGGRAFTVTTVANTSLPTFLANHDHSAYQSISNEQWAVAYSTNPVTQWGNLYLFVDAYSFGINYDLETATTWLEKASVKPPSHFGPSSQLIVPLTHYARENASMFPHVSLPEPYSPNFQNLSGFTRSATYTLADTGWLYYDDVTLHVQTAIAEHVFDSSKVEISLIFIGIVVFCNVAKVCAMGILVKRWRAQPLVTVGDGIASFLDRPDSTTIGCCVATKKEILQRMRSKSMKAADPGGVELVWSSTKFQLRKSMSRRCASVFLGILLTLWWTTFACLIAAFLRKQSGGLWHWGTASELTLDATSSSFDLKSIMINTWLANSPQVLLSASYFYTNSLLTTMYSAHEWNEYGAHRKSLRVSTPEGRQRSQHFLQLPYRIAVPLTVYSGVLHWLLSQSLFLRRIEFRDEAGAIMVDSSLCTCGYSPLSLLIFAIVLFTGSIVVYVTCFLTFKQRLPFGANCSLIISAACHPPPDDVDAHLKAVQWGVVQNRFSSGERAIRHCTFTSEEVTPPEDGKIFATTTPLLTPLNVTLVILILTLLYLRLRPQSTPSLPPGPQPIVFQTFTPRTLLKNNGTANNPVYLAVRGKVYDVSSGRNFYGPGGPYENFAGRDATRGLACQSFDEDMLTKDLDGPLDPCDDLTPEQLDNLNGWIERFDEKLKSSKRTVS